MLAFKRTLAIFILFLSILDINAQPSTNAIRIIDLDAIGLQYDQVRFAVKSGETIKMTLKNSDDMSHNLIITQPGTRDEVVSAALKLGAGGTKVNFVPTTPSVLWYIPLIDPGQVASITFTVPKKPGIYPYVCTFPGHGFIMYGAMYVDTEMPPLNKDQNIPESRREDDVLSKTSSMSIKDDHAEHPIKRDHPYPLVPPFLFRAFLPDTGPDAIGVSLPQQLSYCWDAGTCRLRYAWEGGFLDFTDFWKSYKRYAVEVVGSVFYRDKTLFPLHIGMPGNIPTVKFKGYNLVARYPEFHYTINGIDVYELILAKTDRTGLIRTFRIPKATTTIWFTFDSEDGVDYSCTKGQWENGQLKLSSDEAQKFSIIMTKKEGVKL